MVERILDLRFRKPRQRPTTLCFLVLIACVGCSLGQGVLLQPATRYSIEPAVAFDGKNFLVVWTDTRHTTFPAIYGARVSPQGKVLDPRGLVISSAAGGRGSPAVCSGGTSFLVVWRDERDSNRMEIYGARVTPQGKVLDARGLAIARAGRQQTNPAVSFDGSDFLVVWRDVHDANELDIHGARVSTKGKVLDSAGLVISQAPFNQYEPVAGSDGREFLVAWSDRRGDGSEIYGARVTSSGSVLDTAGIAISVPAGQQEAQGMAESPALAFGSNEFLVAWERSGIYCARVSARGMALDSSGFIISRTGRRVFTPAVAFDGANFLVVWADERRGRGESDICGARVTPQGVVLESAGFVVAQTGGNLGSPLLCFGGTCFLVAWVDGRRHEATMDYRIYGARVTPQGTVLDPSGFAISR